MKKATLITLLAVAIGQGVFGQSKKPVKKPYTDCSICDVFKVHRGKKDHGQKYCVGYIEIRKYTNGKIDTLGWSSGGDTWESNTYDLYIKLSDRNKYIVDSLKEDGIMQLQQSYLTYEPIYMKKGSKVESFWSIETGNVTILKYLFFNNKNGNGFHLVGEKNLN